MRYSRLFGKTIKEAKHYDSVNATLLTKGGFIEQVMSGVYAFLPLGLRVLTKIEQIIREEMDTIGTELLLTAFSSKDAWRATNRLDSVSVLLKAIPANDAARERHNGEYLLNPTHEEVITPIAKKYNPSYKDLPFAVYQIQTKFRNEPRAKSGLLRGREFRMKDLYSFHASEEDFKAFYEQMKDIYKKTFDRLGLGQDTIIALASGGDFTKDYSHEFQTICETGEDTLYVDDKKGIAYNKEVAPDDTSTLREVRASEVGNIFPLGTKFSEDFDYYFTDETGNRQPIYMGCYGIGSSRVMGVLVEKFHDEKGILWPKSVAPFQIHLAALPGGDGESVYQKLTAAGIEVLFDDRVDVSAGEKFADADLRGIPWRFVVSKKTDGQIEVKARGEEETNLVSLDKALEGIT